LIVAAFEVRGYRPHDENVYVVYSEPGRMLGRVRLRDDRTLFLFAFAADVDYLPATLDLAAQKAMLRERFGEGKWECPHILDELDRTQELYFDRVSQIKMESWSRGRVALVGDAAFCVSLMAGQGSALAMTAACVLAGELAKARGRHDVAFGQYKELLRACIEMKQRGAERFADAFAPRTRWGLFFRNQVIKAFAIPGLARGCVWSGYHRHPATSPLPLVGTYTSRRLGPMASRGRRQVLEKPSTGVRLERPGTKTVTSTNRNG
jgi:2-polyprenyl-6-methoxyphenol hydroxylase-like FAD-dependent oxidoreductase